MAGTWRRSSGTCCPGERAWAGEGGGRTHGWPGPSGGVLARAAQVNVRGQVRGGAARMDGRDLAEEFWHVLHR